MNAIHISASSKYSKLQSTPLGIVCAALWRTYFQNLFCTLSHTRKFRVNLMRNRNHIDSAVQIRALAALFGKTILCIHWIRGLMGPRVRSIHDTIGIGSCPSRESNRGTSSLCSYCGPTDLFKMECWGNLGFSAGSETSLCNNWMFEA
jgi:hypothetical protein